ncbi:MAG TPA: DUF5103 domain-containing protein, partial [Prolixibacteraceae bacterium]|nr:DUF5103 domain-containing protein [Prolixibacteraceae bacterium]
MKRSFICSVFFISLMAAGIPASPMRLAQPLADRVFSDHIRTVRLYREGWALSNPVIQLNSDQRLILTFDDLGGDVKDYYYTFFHCDRNWNISSLPREEYFDSFLEFPIIDYEYSVNTKVGYINYYLQLPNDDVRFVLSGNYALVVFDRDDPEEPLLIRRFYVTETVADIQARIRNAPFDLPGGESQEVDFYIEHRNLPFQNPRTDLKVVLTQNNRSDNACTELEPMFIFDGKLEYDYDQGNVFYGNNEFRRFEFRGLKYAGEGVEEIAFYPPLY